jgi:PTH1 family peptidyl-tRNA hydrolase
MLVAKTASPALFLASPFSLPQGYRMQLWVGLGNPGAQYALNRHNVGFMVADTIADLYEFGPVKKAFQGWTQEGRVGPEKILLLKPATFMNESGRSVGEAMRFYKLDLGDVTVFHDELDLDPFRVKVKTGGGTAGHNGLRSTEAHIGNEFRRVRIGIGHPGHKDRVSPHVLGNYAKAEMDSLADLLGAVAAEAPWLAKGDDARFMSDVALRLADS